MEGEIEREALREAVQEREEEDVIVVIRETAGEKPMMSVTAEGDLKSKEEEKTAGEDDEVMTTTATSNADVKRKNVRTMTMESKGMADTDREGQTIQVQAEDVAIQFRVLHRHLNELKMTMVLLKFPPQQLRRLFVSQHQHQFCGLFL